MISAQRQDKRLAYSDLLNLFMLTIRKGKWKNKIWNPIKKNEIVKNKPKQEGERPIGWEL